MKTLLGRSVPIFSASTSLVGLSRASARPAWLSADLGTSFMHPFMGPLDLL